MKELDQRTRLAEIRWNAASDGGRERLPSGIGEPPYAPVVRLLDCDEQENDGTAWSLVVRKLEAGDDEAGENGDGEAEWLAEIAFLVDAAPHETLTTGRRFELYEGARCVASGTILGFAGDRSPCLAMGGPSE
ncbi:MAG TPA: hypothetical protein VGN57_08340 [Pirellulaceae bacterium]|jgi:hypothetical protein|nr:hypothetical protein [Pirellulaceae bacterium]